MASERSSFETSSLEVSSASSPRWEKSGTKYVVSIECLKWSSYSDQRTGDILQTGDIVDEIRIGRVILSSPFRGGKNAVQKILHSSFSHDDTSIQVRVRRAGGRFAELNACIVPSERRNRYILRAIDDPNYEIGFADRTESECLTIQASRNERIVNELAMTQLQDGYVPYPWERRLKEMLCIPNSSVFFSILFLPTASDKGGTRYNDLGDTLARAHAWIVTSQNSGVPVRFMSVQTESLLTKISGETASSTVHAGSLSDLSNLANTSLYGFEDYHGVDVGVMRAVRLWFSPLAGEIPIEIIIKESNTKLGFTISRNDEGFIFISSAIHDDPEVPAARSGLTHLHDMASKAGKLLVVSSISDEKVLPWMVSPTGSIRCFDTTSISQKLSLHRRARFPFVLHLFLWDKFLNLSAADRTPTPTAVMKSSDSAAGDTSFRFHSLQLDSNSNWV